GPADLDCPHTARQRRPGALCRTSRDSQPRRAASSRHGGLRPGAHCANVRAGPTPAAAGATGSPALVEDVVMKHEARNLFLAGVMLAATGCGDEPKAAKAETPVTSLALLTADTTTIDAPLALPSQLYVEHDAVVAPRSSGTVESVLADLGTRVESGQLLAKLESADQEIALGQAENAYAERLVRRTRELTRSGAATVADSERTEMQDRQAELALKKARRDFELTRI